MPTMKKKKKDRYARIIERIFLDRYTPGSTEVVFKREDINQTAAKLRVALISNVGDAIYSFRYRTELPETIRSKAPKGKVWIIRSAGPSRYQFVAVREVKIAPSKMMAETKVPDATPGIIAMYALTDEQALLAKVRYNRLIDVFTGVTCYSLQNHLRTTGPDKTQMETDELYIGVDKRGAHYVFPVQAKGGNDKMGVIQIEQDIAICKGKFPGLICRPIGAQFMKNDVIALYEFEDGEAGITISSEKHYRLVPADGITAEDLRTYLTRTQ